MQDFRSRRTPARWRRSARSWIAPNNLPPAVIGTIFPARNLRRGPAGAWRDGGHERVEPAALGTATGLDSATVAEALDLLEWERWLAADARGYALSAPIVSAILLQEMITPGQARRYRAALQPP